MNKSCLNLGNSGYSFSGRAKMAVKFWSSCRTNPQKLMSIYASALTHNRKRGTRWEFLISSCRRQPTWTESSPSVQRISYRSISREGEGKGWEEGDSPNLLLFSSLLFKARFVNNPLSPGAHEKGPFFCVFVASPFVVRIPNSFPCCPTQPAELSLSFSCCRLWKSISSALRTNQKSNL